MSSKKRKAQVELAEEEAELVEEQKAPDVKGGDGDCLGRKLYLAGIPKAISEDMIRERFAQYGKIEDLVIPETKKVKGKTRIAFLTFKKAKGAQAALAEDGSEFEGSKLKVQLADGSRSKGTSSTDKEDNMTRVFVAGLDDSCDKGALTEFLSKFGQIEELSLPESKSAKKTMVRGFAIVRYKTKQGAAKTIRIMDGKSYDGKTLSVKSYITSASDEKKASKQAKQKALKEAADAKRKQFRVFVSGFPKTSSEHSLREHFEPCGEISHLSIPKKEGIPRGIAFVSFASKVAMTEALRLDGQEFRERPLKVASATAKSE